MSSAISNVRPPPDQLLVDLADYALNYTTPSDEALDTARWCLLDTLACGIMALKFPACTKLLTGAGKNVRGADRNDGSREAAHKLDLVRGVSLRF